MTSAHFSCSTAKALTLSIEILFTWMLNVRSSTRTQTNLPLFSVHFASHFIFILKFFFFCLNTQRWVEPWKLVSRFALKAFFFSLSSGSIFLQLVFPCGQKIHLLVGVVVVFLFAFNAGFQYVQFQASNIACVLWTWLPILQ